MRSAIATAIITLCAGGAAIADVLEDYAWTHRPVIIFADSDRDPRFQKQIEQFEARTEDMEERDVVILTDTDPKANGPLRQKFRPRGFNVLLIGKDGGVKLRTPHPIEADALSRHIDRMPMRRREMRGGQG